MLISILKIVPSPHVFRVNVINSDAKCFLDAARAILVSSILDSFIYVLLHSIGEHRIIVLVSTELQPEESSLLLHSIGEHRITTRRKFNFLRYIKIVPFLRNIRYNGA